MLDNNLGRWRLVLSCVYMFSYQDGGMPRHAPPLQCSDEVKSRLLATGASRTEEVRQVEGGRIILACLEGKEIQQVEHESGASIPTVSKWRKRFAQQGLEGLRDRPRSGKPPRYGAAFRDRVLA
jgi:hypothetical protein